MVLLLTQSIHVPPILIDCTNNPSHIGCEKETAFEILDHFRENGGNFIDTANNYQDEQSEKWIGEWMESRNCRNEMVIATKFTTCYPGASRSDIKLKVNYQ